MNLEQCHVHGIFVRESLVDSFAGMQLLITFHVDLEFPLQYSI